MAKARITISFEYEIVAQHYEPHMTPEQMVALDVANYNEDPLAVLEVLAATEFEVSGVPVTDNPL